MRMRRAQHMQPQRAIFRLVVDELPLPGEKSLVFKTLDTLARTETHIAGKNIHQFVLVSCPIGRVLADFWLETTRPVRHSPRRNTRSVIPGRASARTRNLERIISRFRVCALPGLPE